MISQNSSDSRVVARSRADGLSLVSAVVSDSARALEQCHLCGPTAGLIQAEALAGVALIGADLSGPDEAVAFRMDVSGPIGGFLVEADCAGNLRGYTRVKVLNDLDGEENPDIGRAMGETGSVQFIRSKPGKILNTAVGDSRNPTVLNAVKAYYHDSLQRTASVQLSALDFGSYLDTARGLVLELMPDGSRAAYDRIAERFSDGSVLDCLERGTPLPELCRIIGFRDPVFSEPFPLRFACRCSQSRVERMLLGLPADDLEEMAGKREPAVIHCHFCGKRFEVAPGRIGEILREKKEGGGDAADD